MTAISNERASGLAAGLDEAAQDAGGQSNAAGQSNWDTRRRRLGRWTPLLLGVSGVLLAAWTGYLAASLPGRSLSWHYNIAWTGFDVLLLALVLGTAWLIYRRSRQAASLATATAALLLADAWFDITTAAPGRPVHLAILLAVLVELPSAAFMFWSGQRSLTARSPVIASQAAAPPAGLQDARDRRPAAPQAQHGRQAA